MFSADVITEYILYCAICGCRIKPDDGSFIDADDVFVDRTAWLFDSPQVAIGPLGTALDNTNIAEDPSTGFAIHAEWRYGATVQAGGKPLPVYKDLPMRGDYFNKLQASMLFFPMHSKCFSIVQRTLKRRQGRNYQNLPSTLSEFHEALCQQRRRNSFNFRRLFRTGVESIRMEWEHEYFGAKDFWRAGGFTLVGEWEYLETDPYMKEDLTTPLLDSLMPLPLDNNYVTFTRPTGDAITPIENLPAELLQHIASYLQTRDILSLAQTSRMIAANLLGTWGPSFWREELIQGRLLPFFEPGDVDIHRCRRYSRDTLQGKSTEWDWKSLAKSLASKTAWILDDDGLMRDELWRTLPRGFRNRRRIYEVVMAAKLVSAERMDEELSKQRERLWT